MAFADEHGYALRGKYNEICIGDLRRAKPENLKTVLRHPVKKRQTNIRWQVLIRLILSQSKFSAY